MGTVMGVDLSTQSATVEVRDDETFEVLGRGREPLPATTPPVSEHEVDDWIKSLRKAMEQLTEGGVDLSDIRSVGVSGQCHGLVALDADNRLIRPVKLWNDTTSAAQASRLVSRFGEQFWADRIGSVPTAAWTISKLLWLRENEPEAFDKAEKFVLPHDYLNWWLTGNFVTDRSEASGTGYFSSTLNTYDPEILRECFGETKTWETVLPVVMPPDGIAGGVTKEAASRLGLTPGIPVTVGGGDQHLAALGLGLDAGDVVFSLGTSGVVLTSSVVPVHDSSGMVDGVANTVGGWLPLVSTLNCTKVTDWFARMLDLSVQELDALALEAPAGAGGVPPMAAYLDGERSPSHPGGAGVISGMTSGTTRAQFAAAPFYGVLSGLLRGLDAMETQGIDVGGRIIAVGGGAKSDAFVQFLADLLGRAVEVVREPEATARGACVQALAALRGASPSQVAADLAPQPWRRTEPRTPMPTWPAIRDQYVRTCVFAADAPRH